MKKAVYKYLNILLLLLSVQFKILAQCVSVFPYNEGFETAPTWTPGGTNSDWAWGTPSHPTINSAGGGTKSWCVGGLTGSFYAFSLQSTLTSPCFNFSTLSYPWISFKIFWECERQWDGMQLQYSTNGGATWTKLGSYGDPNDCNTANWYNYNNISWLNSLPAATRHGWSGRIGATAGSCSGGFGSGGWLTASHCLTGLAGQANVIFRFIMGSGTTCNGYDGIAIDDIHISEGLQHSPNFNITCIGNSFSFTPITPPCPSVSSYTWNFGDPSSGALNTSTISSPNHNFSSPGIYTISLTTAGGGCNPPGTTTKTLSVNSFSPVPISQSVTCFGLNNGSGTVTTLGLGPFTYTWLPSGGSASSAVNLAPGNYSVQIMDANNCLVTKTISIFQPPAIISNLTSSNVSCSGGANGSASITVGGGTPAYSYTWSPFGGNSSLASNLIAGTYSVAIKDNNGCLASQTVTIIQPAPITITPSFTNVTCTSLGIASIVVSGGTPGYTYSWSPSGGTNATALNLSSGIYTVSVNDTNLCSQTSTLFIGQTGGTVSAAFSTPTPTQCLVGNSYIFTAATLAGNHSYSFLPTVGTPPSGNSPIYGPVSFTAPGTYTVIHIISSGACTDTLKSIVKIMPTPTITMNSNSPVCLGSNILFTATGGGSYLWSGPSGFTSVMQNPTLTSVNLANSGTYSLTVNLNGCPSTATTNVSISNPTISASNNGPYCVGASMQLNATSANSYTWSGPGGFVSNVQNPTLSNLTTTSAGIYNLVATINSCTTIATTTVTINPLPMPLALNTGPFCQGSTVQLSVGAFATYTWTGPGSFSSNLQNPSINNSIPLNSGTYTVGVTDANGCTNFSATTVVINPTPNVTIGSNGPVCVNTPLNLNAGGGTTYSWSGPNGFTSSLQNPFLPLAVTSNSGVYTVTVTALGCSNAATISVNVLGLTTMASSNGPYCSGGTIQLNTSSANTYTWSGPGGFTSGSQNPIIQNASTSMSGVYNVTVAVGTCTALASTTVIVNALPAPIANNSGPFCSGNTIQLNVGTFNSYNWSGPNAFNSTIQNPSISNSSVNDSGVYTVTVSDANGCLNSATTSVIVNATPLASASGATVCENSNMSLSSSGGNTYLWSGPGNYSSASQNPIISSVKLNAGGQYTVLVSSTGNCTNAAIANVVVHPTPITNITVNSPICVNSIINLTASGGNTYSWSGPNGFTSSLSSPTIQATSVTLGGAYHVTVTSLDGCTSTTNTNVIINAAPSPNITSGPNKGCAPLCVEFTVNANQANLTSSWNLGNGELSNVLSPKACYLSAGVYTITSSVTDLNGCTGLTMYTVEVYPKPIADFNHAPIKPIINQDPFVTFTDASHGSTITSWNWFFNSTPQWTSNEQNPTFTYTDPGTYPVTLVVTSDKGCSDTVIHPLIVGLDFGIYVPNAFTPNDDGLNDVFQPKGYGIDKYQLSVFDRWGEKLFYSEEFELGWKGTYEGRGNTICENGVYTWMIILIDVFGKKHELKGHVNLLR